MSSSAEHRQPARLEAAGHVPAEEQARQQGVRPTKSVDGLAFPGVWDFDQEFDESLADLYSSRQVNPQ